MNRKVLFMILSVLVERGAIAFDELRANAPQDMKSADLFSVMSHLVSDGLIAESGGGEYKVVCAEKLEQYRNAVGDFRKQIDEARIKKLGRKLPRAALDVLAEIGDRTRMSVVDLLKDEGLSDDLEDNLLLLKRYSLIADYKGDFVCTVYSNDFRKIWRIMEEKKHNLSNDDADDEDDEDDDENESAENSARELGRLIKESMQDSILSGAAVLSDFEDLDASTFLGVKELSEKVAEEEKNEHEWWEDLPELPVDFFDNKGSEASNNEKINAVLMSTRSRSKILEVGVTKTPREILQIAFATFEDDLLLLYMENEDRDDRDTLICDSSALDTECSRFEYVDDGEFFPLVWDEPLNKQLEGEIANLPPEHRSMQFLLRIHVRS